MQIYVTKAGQQMGPFTEEQIQSMLQSRTIALTDSGWREGLPAWVPLGQILKASSPAAPSPGFPAPPVANDLQSIYRPPSATLETPSTAQAGTYAGFWWRVLASFIDGIALWIANSLLEFVLGAAGVLHPYMRTDRFEVIWSYFFVTLLVSTLITWLYRALLESSSLQGTLGKMACGLRVTDLQGERISFGRASGRYFGTFISGMILCIGYLMCAFTEKKQTLHDLMAGTLVLKK